MTDLSVIVTAHAEGALAGPSLRSADAAIARVEAAGWTVERLLGLDRPSPAMADWARGADLPRWRQVPLDFGDQGLARNALAEAARGRYVAFLDADDLWGDMWLARALAAAGDGVILHPEIVWQFGAATSAVVRQSQDSDLFVGRMLAVLNPFDALCLAPRTAWISHPFPERDVRSGLAYEDWYWVIDTMDAGWVHRIVPDTIVFKRRRPGSQGSEARGGHCLARYHPALGIENAELLGRTAAPDTDGSG